MKKILILIALFLNLKTIAQPVCCSPDSLLFDSCRQDRIFRIADSMDQVNKQNIINQTKNTDDSLSSLLTVHEVIGIGQSNMVGESDTSRFHFSPLNTCPDDLRQEFRRVFIQQADGSILPLKLGVTNNSIGNASIGPEMGMGYNFELTNKNQNEILVIKKRAISGIPIAGLMKGTTYYDSTWKRLDSMAAVWYTSHRCKIVTKDVVFAQGETDKNNSKSVYYAKLDTFRNNLIQDKRITENSKWCISGISTSSLGYGAGVDSAYKLFTTTHSIGSLIDNNGKGLRSDNIHWTGESIFDIGMEFVVRLFGGKSKSVYTMNSGANPLVGIDGNVNLSAVTLTQLNAANAYADSLFKTLDSISKKLYIKNDSVRHFGGVLKYSVVNGTNVWTLSTSNGSTYYNLKNNVTLSSNFIDIALPDDVHTIRPIDGGGNNGNVTNGVNISPQSGSPYQIALNGYNIGVRVADDRIRVNISQNMTMQLQISYDSTVGFGLAQVPGAPVNLQTSFPPTVTHGKDGQGHVWIKVSTIGVFRPTAYPSIIEAKGGFSWPQFKFLLIPNNLDENYFSVKDESGNYLTDIKQLHRALFIINWGPCQGFIDPHNANMGNYAEINISGDYKVIN